jgi:hypothetical protein
MSGAPAYPLSPLFSDALDRDSYQLLDEVNKGLQVYPAELSTEGLGGTYWLRNTKGRCIAVCKPSDQEPYAPKNPKRQDLLSSSGRMLAPRRGFREGDGYLREVAAYSVDHGHFAGVPLTFAVTYNLNGEQKLASLQIWKDHDGSADDFGQSKFPKLAIQKIAVLDIRILNCDRHAGNLLISEEDIPAEVIPIDHGYCFPSTAHEAYFEWLNWSQVNCPTLPEVRRYIEALDIDRDVAALQKLNISPSAIRNFVICSQVLKLGTALGLSLYQIGCIVSPNEATRTSPLADLTTSLDEDLVHTESMFISTTETFLKDWTVSV